MQKKGRGDMIPPTNSELKHQQALRAAQVDPMLLCASTGNPTDLAGDSGALETGLAATQLGPSQDCTSESAAKWPAQVPAATAHITVRVSPQHRQQQPGASPDQGTPSAAATPKAAATTAAAPVLRTAPSHADKPHPHGQPVLCSMPYADSYRAQQGVAQWVPYPAHPSTALDNHTGGVYVVAAPPEAATPKAPMRAAAHGRAPMAKAAAGMNTSSAPPAGLFSSLLDRDTTSGPRLSAPAARPPGKPSVDYASIYTFLASCFDLTNCWQELVSALTRMPNKERQLTVTLMGRVLSQMESRMQHTRGTAPPGWADLHHAAKASGVAKGAADAPPQQVEAVPSADPDGAPLAASAAPPVAAAAPTKRLSVPFVPGDAVLRHAVPGELQAQQCNGPFSSAVAQMHVPGDGPMPVQFVAVGASRQTPVWPQPGMPGAPMVEHGQWAGLMPPVADLDIGAEHQAAAQQCERLAHPQAGLPQDQPMSDTPAAVFAQQQAASRPAAEAQVTACKHAGAPAAAGQHCQEARSPQNAAQVVHGRQPAAAAAPAPGGLRSMPFHNLMPIMQGPQSLAARAAFDARFDACMARAPMQGPRMADVQVHGPRPVAQQMIPTPAIPSDSQAKDPRQANASSNQNPTPGGPPLKASASAADYLMSSAAAAALDSCMDGDEDDGPRAPLLPPDLGMRQAPPTAMWMSAADGELVSQSAAHSATLCATESAWTAVGNGGTVAVAPMHSAAGEQARQQGYAWHHHGWAPPGMSAAPPGMHVPLQALLQQQHLQGDKIGRLIMAEDGDTGLLGGPDFPPNACMIRMHDEPMQQQSGVGVMPTSPGAEAGGVPREGNAKLARQHGAVEAGPDGAGSAMWEMASMTREDWLQECRQRQQQAPPWAAGRPVI